LRQGPHIKVAAVASPWQRVGDLIGSGSEPHTSRTRGRRLTTCASGQEGTKIKILEKFLSIFQTVQVYVHLLENWRHFRQCKNIIVLLRLAETRFRLNVFSSKRSKTIQTP